MLNHRFDGSFENHAEIGDRIRAWDFERREGVEDRYVEGIIVAKGIVPILCDEEGLPYGGGFCGFTIVVDYDSVDWGTPENRVGLEVYVPYDNFCDFDYRVEKL